MCTDMHMMNFRALFPLLLVGPSAATVGLMALAVPPAFAMTMSVVGLLLVLAILERRAPFRAAWNERQPGELWTDLAYLAFASVPDRATRLLVEAAMIGVVGWAAATQPPGSAIQVVLLASAAFLLSDLGKYLIHRASHQHPWLWRFHLAHHRPSRLSAWNALHLHPINVAYNAAIDTVPLLLLGVTPGVAAVLATIRATVGIVQHANLDLEGGRQWLVNAPSYHRTHHDVRLEEANHNFASTLLVWDRVFGTLRRAPAPAEVGVGPAPHRVPRGFIGQLIYPACGARLDTTCWMARFPGLIR